MLPPPLTHAHHHLSDSCSSSHPSPHRTQLQSHFATQDNSLQISYKDWYIYLNEQSNNRQLYPYTQHLLELESHTDAVPIPLPPSALEITTPLVHHQWEKALALHPDRQFVQYILSGIAKGFHIGVNRLLTCKRAKGNMHSASLHPTPVEDYLRTELQAGRIRGPVPDNPLIQISRFGVIPKSGQPGKWRLILDLSSPHGNSVNDAIQKDLCSLTYATVDQAVRRILHLGQGTLLAKIDIQHAFRNIPIHPADRKFLGMSWNGCVYVDTVLPFGLRSAPKIFNAIADALEWVLSKEGVTDLLHYLDDFLFLGSPASQECSNNLQTTKSSCSTLGLPLKHEKVEGPTTMLVFLGILLDTVAMEMRLPDGKVAELHQLIAKWSSKRAGKKRELLSLIGKLSHAAKIVVPGRIFLRRMIDTANKAKQLDHWIHLTTDFKSDLAWWRTFLQCWNGKSMMRVLTPLQPPAFTITTDASGSWGCGAYWLETHKWLQRPWLGLWEHVPIHTKELLPILLAAATWGARWRDSHILFKCDNMAVVNILASSTSRDPLVMHLLRTLHFILAFYNVHLIAKHIAGSNNSIADAISRNLPQVLFSQAPEAEPQPTPVPEPLWDILVIRQPDWLSDIWRTSLIASLTTASPPLPEKPTLRRKQDT